MTSVQSYNREQFDLKSNPIIEEMEDESLLKKLRKYLIRPSTQETLKTLSVDVLFQGGCYGWKGEWNHKTCIFAKYKGTDELGPWTYLKILQERKVITSKQGNTFGIAISNFDSKKGTEKDLENIQELATILGMEVYVR